MNRVELSDRIADMWRRSRYDAGKSQEYIARALGVSKKTVQNWESGDASPNFRVALEWFDALGVPMYPYLMSVIYPTEIESLSRDSSMNDIRKALSVYIDELDDLHARELLFLLYGDHGSSPTGLMDSMTAYLHMPLMMRVCITDSVLSQYKLASEIGLIEDSEHILPKVETLERCLKTAKEAVRNGKESYTIIKEEKPCDE